MPAGIGVPTAIVLAAGLSDRLMQDKLLLDLGGIPMLQRTVECYTKSSRIGDVIVVLKPGGKEAWTWLSSLRVHLIENPDPSRGMISSIRVGLDSAWVKGKDFLIAPADVPFVKFEVIDKVVLDFRARRCQILIPTYRGLGGHPGMYSSELQKDFFLYGDKHGAKDVLMRNRDKTVRLSVHDPDICFDIDTESDAAVAMDPGARWARVDGLVEANPTHRPS